MIANFDSYISHFYNLKSAEFEYILDGAIIPFNI